MVKPMKWEKNESVALNDVTHDLFPQNEDQTFRGDRYLERMIQLFEKFANSLRQKSDFHIVSQMLLLRREWNSI